MCWSRLGQTSFTTLDRLSARVALRSCRPTADPVFDVYASTFQQIDHHLTDRVDQSTVDGLQHDAGSSLYPAVSSGVRPCSGLTSLSLSEPAVLALGSDPGLERRRDDNIARRSASRNEVASASMRQMQI
jgi:hypothetical protein